MKLMVNATLALCLGVLLVGCDRPSISISTAIADGNVDEVRRHVAWGTNLNQKEPQDGQTPLILTAYAGRPEIAKVLIEGGADVDAQNNDGNTALSIGAAFCRTRVVNLLLENGAEINLKNGRGQTPLDHVSADWNPVLEEIYKVVAKAVAKGLKTELDLERIKNDRPAMAALLRKHGGKSGK